MKIQFSVARILAVASALVLSACASMPDNLKSDNPSLITDYQIWMNTDPKTHPQVRLGGVIAKVTNLKNQTRIEVVNLPIDDTGRPDLDRDPQGRFVGYVKGFVDPVTYAEGRLITLIGTTSAPEQETVGDYQYTFPVIQVSGYYLWRVEQRVLLYDNEPHFYPCRGFYCHYPFGGPREARIIQELN